MGQAQSWAMEAQEVKGRVNAHNVQLAGLVQGRPHICAPHWPGYLPREGKERQRKGKREGEKRDKRNSGEGKGREGRGSEGEGRKPLRSSRLLTELPILTQKHTALPDLSKARNVKCNLSLKFNSTRMKRKCFAELWHLSGHAFFSISAMQRCLYSSPTQPCFI